MICHYKLVLLNYSNAVMDRDSGEQVVCDISSNISVDKYHCLLWLEKDRQHKWTNQCSVWVVFRHWPLSVTTCL